MQCLANFDLSLFSFGAVSLLLSLLLWKMKRYDVGNLSLPAQNCQHSVQARATSVIM